jgi:hypothetical protein
MDKHEPPILRSSIRYEKHVPKFLKELISQGPNVNTKFERIIVPSVDSENFHADEQPTYEADEAVLELYRRQEEEKYKEQNFTVDQSKLDSNIHKRKEIEQESTASEIREEQHLHSSLAKSQPMLFSSKKNIASSIDHEGKARLEIKSKRVKPNSTTTSVLSKENGPAASVVQSKKLLSFALDEEP